MRAASQLQAGSTDRTKHSRGKRRRQGRGQSRGNGSARAQAHGSQQSSARVLPHARGAGHGGHRQAAADCRRGQSAANAENPALQILATEDVRHYIFAHGSSLCTLLRARAVCRAIRDWVDLVLCTLGEPAAVGGLSIR